MFHEVLIVNGAKTWEKYEGDFFPVWLEKIATAITRPLPLQPQDLATDLGRADVKYIFNSATFTWAVDPSIDGERTTNKAYVQVNTATGLIYYTGGPDWGGMYEKFSDFHGKPIARKVSEGSVVADLAILEDLPATPADAFDVNKPGGNDHAIQTIVLDTDGLQKNLIAEPQFDWPDLPDGPFDGEVFTTLVIDQFGHVRELGNRPVAENEGVRDAAAKGFQSLRFKPFLKDGVPVQVIGRFSVRFHVKRPAGMENFDSAQTYLERAERLSFLHSSDHKPYHLLANVGIMTPQGLVVGNYEETWFSAERYRRDLTINADHLVQSHDGDKAYQQAEGADAARLTTIMALASPSLPAKDLVEADWCVRRGEGDARDTIGVIRCSPNDQGGRDLLPNSAYWVNDRGEFVHANRSGFEIKASNPQPYDGANVPREIDVYAKDRLIITFTVTGIGAADPTAKVDFALPGHELDTHRIAVALPKPSN